MILFDLIFELTTGRELQADINAYDRYGNTALAISAGKGLYTAVEHLLSLGANPNATNYERNSILEIARTSRDSARETDNNPFYADLLSCEKRLIESAALRHVTALVEFGVGRSIHAESRRKGLSQTRYFSTPGVKSADWRGIWPPTICCSDWEDYDNSVGRYDGFGNISTRSLFSPTKD